MLDADHQVDTAPVDVVEDSPAVDENTDDAEVEAVVAEAVGVVVDGSQERRVVAGAVVAVPKMLEAGVVG